ncbi:NlpC/P60 family protein [Henriciella sp. AS95]|uniref:C40 family peptidase n=1 Tax=Henriciella sp. AS95 TaxID=3135782 RepID=UPI003176D7B8
MPTYDDARLTITQGALLSTVTVSAGLAPVRSKPRLDSEMVTQALYGETLCVYERVGEFGLAQLNRDRYVGWILLSDLARTESAPTHRVSALQSHAYARPDLKSAMRLQLPMGARLAVSKADERFVEIEGGFWVPEQHVVPVENLESDPAKTAERFIGAPYLWGGCDAKGLDCTGLTRAAFDACGVTLPRDSDMQFAWSGAPIADWKAAGALQRNDLVFWKGHVGIMLDDMTLLHANAYHMAVEAEPLSGAIQRIAKHYGEPIGARRINIYEERLRTPEWLSAA